MLNKINLFSNGMVYQAFNILVKNSLTFKRTYSFLQRSQWWSAEQLKEYQLEQLNKLLEHAYDNVPYYTKVFDDIGLRPKDIQDFKDLDQLPFLTRDIIRKNFKDLCSKKHPINSFQTVTTGGSTSGVPLGIYLEKGITDAKEWAFMKTQWDRVGYRFRDKCAVFRGYGVPTSENTFWKSQLLGRWTIFSSYGINSKNISKYADKLKDFNPDFIQAYPSSISLLARHLNENNIHDLPQIKAILCSSEILYPTQKQLLEETFNTRVYSWYGQTEKVVLGGECEVGDHYHIFPEYGVTELIDESGRSIKSGTGEIVGTGFNNYAMPLIRYRTGDMGVLTNKKCECGREYPLIEGIEGRAQNVIITKNNSKIMLTALVCGDHFNSFSHIMEFQIVQEKKGEVIFNIVKAEKFDCNCEKEILYKVKRISNDKIDVIFNYVDSIPKTIRGKHNLLIQKLDLDI
jgi:phenylacetate-CoA ligase